MDSVCIWAKILFFCPVKTKATVKMNKNDAHDRSYAVKKRRKKKKRKTKRKESTPGPLPSLTAPIHQRIVRRGKEPPGPWGSAPSGVQLRALWWGSGGGEIQKYRFLSSKKSKAVILNWCDLPTPVGTCLETETNITKFVSALKRVTEMSSSEDPFSFTLSFSRAPQDPFSAFPQDPMTKNHKIGNIPFKTQIWKMAGNLVQEWAKNQFCKQHMSKPPNLGRVQSQLGGGEGVLE